MKKTSYLFIICTLITGVIISCTAVDTNDFLEKDENAPIKIDSISYSSDGQSVFTRSSFKNTSGKSIYFPTFVSDDINPIEVEKRVNGEWIFAYTIFSQAIDTPPLEVAPDSVLKREFPIYFPELLKTQSIEETKGTYRLVFGLYESWDEQKDEGRLLPKEQRVSNSFQIEK